MTITFETPDENGDQAPRRASQQKKRNSVAFKRTSVKFASPTPSESEEVESISDDEPVGSRNIWLMRSLQGAAVVLMLTAVIGTCYYAISSSNDTTPPRETFNSSNPYTPNFSQYCANGIVNTTYYGEVHNKAKAYTSFWYQNAENKTLHVKLDKDTIAMVFEKNSVFGKLDKHGEIIRCTHSNMGYDQFLHELSLVDMVDRHSEIRRFHNTQPVFVFEGPGYTFTYTNTTPFLVQAYGSIEDGRLTGFEAHYNPKKNNDMLFVSYRYYNMVLGVPEDHPYKTLPSLCLEQ